MPVHEAKERQDGSRLWKSGAFHEVAIDYAYSHRPEDQSAKDRTTSENFETPVEHSLIFLFFP